MQHKQTAANRQNGQRVARFYLAMTVALLAGALWLGGARPLVAAPWQQTSSAVPTPVGYWRMEDMIENNVLNSVAGSGDALLVGDTVLDNNPPDNNVGWISSATAKNSNAARFDGVGDHMAVTANNVYNLSNEVTLAAWVNLANPSADQKIVGKLWLDLGFSGVDAEGYLLGVEDGQIKAEIHDANQVKFEAKGGTIPATTWTHIALTWKTSGQLIGYINGAAVVTTTAGTLPIGNRCEVGKGGCNVIIGAAPWNPADHNTAGNIDEVLIFNQALAPDAITQLAQRTFIVADPGDSADPCAGDSCTLRAAINGANAGPNGTLRDRIHFALPTPAIMQPTAELPPIIDPVIIDGLTQPGASCATWPPTLKVALDGSNAGNQADGLQMIDTREVEVRGLNIRNFSGSGIAVVGGSFNLIECNLIGTNLAGDTSAPNEIGVEIDSTANNTVGGKDTGNLVAHNRTQGVRVSGVNAVGNFIAENRIHHNGGLGLDLGAAGVTANDPGDADGDANNLQNFPVLNGARANGSTTTISGTLNSQANTRYLIEFYSNAANDACQGETFVGFAFVTTNGSGDIAFTTTLTTSVPSGRKLSATASAIGDDDNPGTFDTSEFSACVPVIALPPVSPTVSLTPFQPTFNEGAGSAALTARLSVSTSVPISVIFSTIVPGLPANEVATPGNDYTAATNQSIVIPAGQLSATLPIPIFNDSVVEQNEKFGVTLALPANSIATLDFANSTSVVTIADNDGANNTPPVAQAQTVNVQAGVPQLITLVGVDADSDPLTFTILTQPQNGEVNGIPPKVSYNPNTPFVGTDTFTFKVNDGKVDSAPVTVTLLVRRNSSNTPPVAQAQTVNVQAGVALEITLVGVDTESDPLTFTITQPQNGTVTGAVPNVTYNPNPGFVGTDTFTFKVNDGLADSPSATITLVVGAPPVGGNNKLFLPIALRQE